MYANDIPGHIGQIHDAMFRAVRLVVDTGMHAKHWSREKAIRYYASTIGDQDVSATTEIERYVVWPGQACSYMLGKIEWLKQRERAKAALGAKFDIPQIPRRRPAGGRSAADGDGKGDRRLHQSSEGMNPKPPSPPKGRGNVEALRPRIFELHPAQDDVHALPVIRQRQVERREADIGLAHPLPPMPATAPASSGPRPGAATASMPSRICVPKAP